MWFLQVSISGFLTVMRAILKDCPDSRLPDSRLGPLPGLRPDPGLDPMVPVLVPVPVAVPALDPFSLSWSRLGFHFSGSGLVTIFQCFYMFPCMFMCFYIARLCSCMFSCIVEYFHHCQVFP